MRRRLLRSQPSKKGDERRLQFVGSGFSLDDLVFSSRVIILSTPAKGKAKTDIFHDPAWPAGLALPCPRFKRQNRGFLEILIGATSRGV